MINTNSKMNPLIAAAAVAVIIFSAVGVGVMTGVIPSSRSANDVLTSSAEPKAPLAPEPKTAAAPVNRPAPKVAQKPAPRAEPRQQLAMNDPTPAPRCASCGVVNAVRVIDKKGASTPIGVVGGAVVGGLVGNQIGQGRGNTAATVVGAVGGAVAGTEVEKRVRSTKEYQVIVRMDDGDTRTFAFDSAPGYVAGEKIKVVDGRLVRG